MQMRHILYYIAAAIIVIWAITFIFYSLGFIIHTLLLIAAVLIIVRVAQGKKLID
jgi:hypothetical protein